MMHDRCFFPQAIPLHDLTDILIFLENMQSFLAPSATAIIHEYPPFLWLQTMESNHLQQLKRLLCYRYTNLPFGAVCRTRTYNPAKDDGFQDHLTPYCPTQHLAQCEGLEPSVPDSTIV